MVAVAPYHGGQVLAPVFPEKGVVVILQQLGLFPDVERLVHHDHAQLVAAIQEIRRRGIVGAADRIETVGLDQFHLAALGPVDSDGAQYAIVMMEAGALELIGLAVDLEARFGRHADGADPETLADLVRHLSLAGQRDLGRVQVWRIGGPQRRLIDIELCIDYPCLPGRQRYIAVGRGDYPTATIPKDDPVLGDRGLSVAVFDFNADGDPGPGFTQQRRW